MVLMSHNTSPRSRSEEPGTRFNGALPALLIGVGAGVYIPLVGQLYVGEVLALVILISLLLRSRDKWRLDPPSRRLLTRIVLTGIIWLTGTAIADLVRGTPPEAAAKAWVSIIVTVLLIVVLVGVIRSVWACYAAALGLAVGYVVGYVLQPNVYAQTFPWKFGYGAAVTLLVVVACAAAQVGKRMSSLILVCFGAVHMYLGFRSASAICLLTALLVLFNRPAVSRRSLRTATRNSIVLTIGAGLFISAYGAASRAAVLSDEVGGAVTGERGALGLLVAARPELVFSAVAFSQKPVIGHGSRARRTSSTDAPATAFLADRGYRYAVPVTLGAAASLVPAHSYILGAAVAAGVFALPFWLTTLKLLVSSMLSQPNSMLLGVLGPYLAVQGTWDVLASPFGGSARLSLAMTIAVLLFAQSQAPTPDRRPGAIT